MVSTRKKNYTSNPPGGKQGCRAPLVNPIPSTDLASHPNKKATPRLSSLSVSTIVNAQPEIVGDSTIQAETSLEDQALTADAKAHLSNNEGSMEVRLEDDRSSEQALSSTEVGGDSTLYGRLGSSEVVTSLEAKPADVSPVAVLDDAIGTESNKKEASQVLAFSRDSNDSTAQGQLVSDQPRLPIQAQDIMYLPEKSKDVASVERAELTSDNQGLRDGLQSHAEDNGAEMPEDDANHNRQTEPNSTEGQSPWPPRDVSGGSVRQTVSPVGSISNHVEVNVTGDDNKGEASQNKKRRCVEIDTTEDEGDKTEVDERDPYDMLEELRKKEFTRRSSRPTKERKLHSGVISWATQSFDAEQTNMADDIYCLVKTSGLYCKPKLRPNSKPKERHNDCLK